MSKLEIILYVNSIFPLNCTRCEKKSYRKLVTTKRSANMNHIFL